MKGQITNTVSSYEAVGNLHADWIFDIKEMLRLYVQAYLRYFVLF